MGADVDQAGLDVRDAFGVAGAVGFRKQGRALDVGREHEVDQRLGAARRLLLDAAEAGVPGHGDRAALRREIAADEPEKGGLARTIAPYKPDPRSARQRGGRVVDEDALAEPVGQGVDMQHGGLLARRAFACKTERTFRSALLRVEQGAFLEEQTRRAGADQRGDDEEPKLRDAFRV